MIISIAGGMIVDTWHVLISSLDDLILEIIYNESIKTF